MGKMDLTSDISVAPEQGSFQVIEWEVRSSASGANPDAEMDNGCACGCGCA